MSPTVLWAMVALAFAIVVVRRRSLAVGLLAAQSIALGIVAIAELGDHHPEVAVVALAVRGVGLPALLLWVVRRTREPRHLASERFALPRLVAALVVVSVVVAVTPAMPLDRSGAGEAALALVALGVVLAALRRSVVFQAVGFLTAENGVFVAGLAVHGGVPVAVELGLLFDLIVVMAVIAAFGTVMHRTFGTSDTGLLRSLRD